MSRISGRFGAGIGDDCRRDVACELILTYGGFPRASCSCKLVVVVVSDIVRQRRQGKLSRKEGLPVY